MNPERRDERSHLCAQTLSIIVFASGAGALSFRLAKTMVRKVDEQGIVTIISRTERLARKLGDCAANRLNLRKNVEFIIECYINRSEILIVERDWIRGTLNVNNGLSCCVPDREFVEHIWVVIGKISDDKPAS